LGFRSVVGIDIEFLRSPIEGKGEQFEGIAPPKQLVHTKSKDPSDSGGADRASPEGGVEVVQFGS